MDENDNPTPRLKVKLQLWKRKEVLWKLALEVPTKKRKIDQEGADESGFEGDCSEAEGGGREGRGGGRRGVHGRGGGE